MTKITKRHLSTVSLATIAYSSPLLTAAASLSSTSVAVYWADMSIPACTSSPPPASLHENKLFNSKIECCEKMLPWLNGHCVGNDDDDDAKEEPVENVEPVDTIHIVESGEARVEIIEKDNNSEEDASLTVDCNTLSTSECESESSCERIRKKLENGLWISVCDFKYNESAEDSTETSSTGSTTTVASTSSTTEGVDSVSPTEGAAVSTMAPSESSAQDNESFTNSPTASITSSPTVESSKSSETPASVTSSPTVDSSKSSEAPAFVSSSPTVDSSKSSEAPTSITSSPTESQDPSLYCAFSFENLESSCHQAPRCNNNPCPSGMFCFPHECTYTPESVAETIISAAKDGSLLPDITSSPSLHLSTDSPTLVPSTEAPITPTNSPTPSPTRRYSTSDFIVELIEWSNIGIDESLSSSPQDEPHLMSSVYNQRTFAPTFHPTSYPTNHPTNHPVSNSPTSQPTQRAIPTMELILPSIADATISNSRPNDNFGNLEAIAVNGGNLNTDTDRFDAILSFDVSLILDPSYTIVEASIHLFTMNSCANGGSSIYITQDVPWEETTVNWNTAPQAQGIPIASLEDRQISKQWIMVDVTDAISVWRGGYRANDSVLSLRIMSATESLCMFASGESGDEYKPKLIVRYSSTRESGLQTMSGSMYGYDSSYDVSTSSSTESPLEGDAMTSSSTEAPREAAPTLLESTEEITLLATADASLSNIRQSQNFGAQNAIVVDGGNFTTGMIRGSNEESEQFDALIKFDTSSIDGSRVDNVSLRIHLTNGCEYGGDIYATTEVDWDQESVTWGDAPRAVGEPLGILGAVEDREWYTVDLSGDNILSSNTLTLRVSSTRNSRCMFTSVDRGEETAPRLIVKIKSTVPQTLSAGFSEAAIEPTLQATQVIIPTTGNFILIVASDDATIDANSPSTVDGDSPFLHVDYNERSRVIRDTVIRFDLAQMKGGVLPRSALLTLFTEDACANAGTFMSTEGNGEWNENEVTWTTAPNNVDNGSYEGGNMIGTFGAVEKGRWYGFSVVDALTEAVLMRKQAVTFRLTSGGMQSCSYSSIQSGRPPKILVAF